MDVKAIQRIIFSFVPRINRTMAFASLGKGGRITRAARRG